MVGVLSRNVYFGTMNFAWQQASKYVDVATASEMLRRFRDAGGTRLDTARIYAGGATEPMVAEAMAAVEGVDWALGTKAHPSQAGGLGAEGLVAQLAASRAAHGDDAFPYAEYYLHQPDTEHALLESLEKATALWDAGAFGKLGMSNYHASEVQRCFELCDAHGFVKPTVYQGLYNPLNRAVEAELLPLLKANGCAFVAYNGLAAGLLTGKHASLDAVAAGRFKNNPNYLPRFYTPANFAAVASIRDACDDAGISMVQAAYSWVLKHSALDLENGDGVLLGASTLDQLDANIDACRDDGGDDLPGPVLAALDAAWDTTRDGAFAYWRSYSADMPGRDTLDQGASYDAAKKKA